MYQGQSVRELQRLSDTRWACRYAACATVRDRLAALVELLSELEAGNNAKRAVEARSLLASLDSRFVSMLLVMCSILGKTQSLSVMLQSAVVDFSCAVNLINVVCTDIKELRSQDDKYLELWDDAVTLCEQCGIEWSLCDEADPVAARPPTRKRKASSMLKDSHVMATVVRRPDSSSKQGFKVIIYYPVMDCLLAELERRFASDTCDVLKAMQALNPSSENFGDVSCVEKFAAAYAADVSDLSHELPQAKRLLERMPSEDRPQTLLSFVSYIQRYKEAFPELYTLGVISICLPVSTATCERSFSALRHIKTWVRNSISNPKLNSVALLGIERDRTLSLDTEKVIDALAAAHKNRRIALV